MQTLIRPGCHILIMRNSITVKISSSTEKYSDVNQYNEPAIDDFLLFSPQSHNTILVTTIVMTIDCNKLHDILMQTF